MERNNFALWEIILTYFYTAGLECFGFTLNTITVVGAHVDAKTLMGFHKAKYQCL